MKKSFKIMYRKVLFQKIFLQILPVEKLLQKKYLSFDPLYIIRQVKKKGGGVSDS